jgi:hypothetical protein
MQIGQRLLRANLVKVDQVEAALHAQTRVGGRIGTNLIRMGALDFDTLAWVLGEHTGVPAAKIKQFERVETSTLELLPAALAAKHFAIPLYVVSARGGKELTVALRDPKVLVALDEIAAASGARVVPFVAPELAIVQYLEELYGIHTDVEVRGRASGSRPPRRASGIAQTPDALERAMFGEADAQALSMVSAPAHQSIDLVLDEPIDFVPSEPPPPLNEGEVPEPPPVYTLEEAIAAIRSATSKDQVGEAMCGFLRLAYGVGLILITRGGMALGWKGFASGIDQNLIEAVTIPLSAHSMFAVAFDRKAIFRGPPPESGVTFQSRMFRLLRSEPPREVIVAPVLLNNRVISLIYVHATGGGELPASATSDLEQLTQAASDAFVRLIKTHKGATQASLPAG